MKGVDNMEYVRLLETHLSLIGLVVVEVGFDVEGIATLQLRMSGDEYMIMRIDSRPYISLYLDDLVILLPSVLGNQVDLVVEAEQEEDGLLPGHPSHVHVIHLDDLVPGLQSLLGGRTSRLNSSDKDANVVAPCQSNAHGSLFLEADEARVRQVALRGLGRDRQTRIFRTPRA